MKFSKWYFTAVVSVLTSSAYAEFTPLSMDEMSNTTGQAGLTIDINKLKMDVGAVDYQDQGFLTIRDISLDNQNFDGFGLDNIQMTVDVVGATNDLGAPSLGAQQLIDDGAAISVTEWDQNAELSNGDLVISLRAIDDSAGALAIDYGLSIGMVGLIDSGYSSVGTVIAENIVLSGYLGPIDIVIDNGNQGMNINAYFNAFGAVEMPFVETRFNMSIHNGRGADYVVMGSSYEETFAHAQVNIAKYEFSNGDTALAFDLIDFSAEIDLTDIQLGNNGQSIGNLYLTDLTLSANTAVYGH